MPLLSGGPGSRKPAQGMAERLVVCEDEELSAFQHQAKVVNGGVDCQQLHVERRCNGSQPATASLRRRREEPKTNDESVLGRCQRDVSA